MTTTTEDQPWTCRTCGLPIVPNVDARYTIADDEVSRTGEHYRCKEIRDRQWELDVARLEAGADKMGDLLRKLRRHAPLRRD